MIHIPYRRAVGQELKEHLSYILLCTVVPLLKLMGSVGGLQFESHPSLQFAFSTFP